jgi:Tfp pilus assembly protein PilN
LAEKEAAVNLLQERNRGLESDTLKLKQRVHKLNEITEEKTQALAALQHQYDDISTEKKILDARLHKSLDDRKACKDNHRPRLLFHTTS